MIFSEIELPSNRKFGFFFTFVFALAAAYFYYTASMVWFFAFALSSAIFLVVTFVKADILLPLNNLWMRFGLLLGMIVSPIVLGIIFFGLITPYGLIMKLFGRDELLIHKRKTGKYWVSRSKDTSQTDFTKQF